MLSENSFNITILELFWNNYFGINILIHINNSTLNILSGQIFNISTSSAFIFWIFDSNFTISNSYISQFYPVFTYQHSVF